MLSFKESILNSAKIDAKYEIESKIEKCENLINESSQKDDKEYKDAILKLKDFIAYIENYR